MLIFKYIYPFWSQNKTLLSQFSLPDSASINPASASCHSTPDLPTKSATSNWFQPYTTSTKTMIPHEVTSNTSRNDSSLHFPRFCKKLHCSFHTGAYHTYVHMFIIYEYRIPIYVFLFSEYVIMLRTRKLLVRKARQVEVSYRKKHLISQSHYNY